MSRSGVERWFRFLKDRSLHVSEEYLKGKQNRSIGNDYGAVSVHPFNCAVDAQAAVERDRKIR